MILKNISQNTEITSELKIATSFMDKLFGLLRENNKAMLFRTRFGIHTFFLNKPIDIIVLDKKLKVVKSETVLPNKLFFWNPKFYIVIELPAETIKKSYTKVGDLLIFSTKEPLSF